MAAQQFRVRKVAPVYTATKWIGLGDHPLVRQASPIDGGSIESPRGNLPVDIGDWILEGGPEGVQVVPWHEFEISLEPVEADRDTYALWKADRVPHPNEGGVDNGVVGHEAVAGQGRVGETVVIDAGSVGAVPPVGGDAKA